MTTLQKKYNNFNKTLFTVTIIIKKITKTKKTNNNKNKQQKKKKQIHLIEFSSYQNKWQQHTLKCRCKLCHC